MEMNPKVRIVEVPDYLVMEDAALQGASLGELQLLRTLIEDKRIKGIQNASDGSYGWRVMDETLNLKEALTLVNMPTDGNVH